MDSNGKDEAANGTIDAAQLREADRLIAEANRKLKQVWLQALRYSLAMQQPKGEA